MPTSSTSSRVATMPRRCRKSRSPSTAARTLASAVGGNARGGPEALSHREHQVFRLLTLGHSVSEIGARLQLAPNTVSTYRARILEKTGTKNDVELALYAERLAKPGPASAGL